MYVFQVELVFLYNNIMNHSDKQKVDKPGIYNFQLKSKETNLYGSQLGFALNFLGSIQLDSFGGIHPKNIFVCLFTENKVNHRGDLRMFEIYAVLVLAQKTMLPFISHKRTF